MAFDYQSPTVTTWGSITDLTQGTGKSVSTDDFVSCTPDGPFKDGYIGSNDNPTQECDGVGDPITFPQD